MSQGYTRGIPIDTDVTLSGNSDSITSSQKAIKTYSDTTILANTAKIQSGTNIYTGGTAYLPTANVSALTINTLITSGDTSFQNVTATTFSATSINSNILSFTNLTGGTSASVNNLSKLNIGTTSLSANSLSSVRIVNGGTGSVDIGDSDGFSGAIWINQSAITSTNFSIGCNSTGSYAENINIFNANKNIFFSLSGITQFVFSDKLATFGSGITNYFLTLNNTKLGLSTNEKIALWNSAPITQPTNSTPLNVVLTSIGLMQSGATDVKFNLPVSITGSTTLATIGSRMVIASGTNASVGVVTLVAGTATVSNTLITNGSIINLTPQTLGTITRPVGLGITGRTAGVSFTIVSDNVTDTSVIGWTITEPV